MTVRNEGSINPVAGVPPEGGAQIMIEVRTLTKQFEGFTALDSMELHVPKGSVYGLVGPNGAGKTTLIRHIAGVYYPDGGDVLVDGEPVWENPDSKVQIFHIPDDLQFFPSAKLNDLAAYYKGLYPNFDKDRFEKLKATFQLDTGRRVGRFSKGMQKQAAIIMALCCMPDVLLLDEPVDGLDPVARRTVWSLILRDVAVRQTTVLISSHNLRELDGVSDHIGIMRGGKLLLERALADLQGEVTKLQVLFAPAQGAGASAAGNGATDINKTGVPASGIGVGATDGAGGIGAGAAGVPDDANFGGAGGIGGIGVGTAGVPDDANFVNAGGMNGNTAADGDADGAGSVYDGAATGDAPAAVQFALPGFEILHTSQNGRIAEYIIRGGVDNVLSAVNALDPPPLFADAVPLTLEEIFIYELGGMGYVE